MIGKMIITVFSGIILVALTLQLFLCGLPLFRRLEMDAVCHKYVLLMDQAGGLTADLSFRLHQDLTNRGFQVTRISGTPTAAFGTPLNLTVAVTWPTSRFRRDLSAEEVNLSLTYQSSTICRVIAN